MDDQENADNKDMIFAGLSVLGLVADVITIFQFSASGSVLNPWSGQWLVVIFLIMFLFFISALAASASNFDKLKFGIEVVFCGLFYFCGALMLMSTSFIQIYSGTYFFDYVGFIILSIVSIGIGVVIDAMKSKSVSYLMFFVTLSEIVMMINKYLFVGMHVEFVWFFGEFGILLLSAAISIAMLYGMMDNIRGILAF